MGTYRLYSQAIDTNAEAFADPCRLNPALAIPPPYPDICFANPVDEVFAPEWRNPPVRRYAPARLRAGCRLHPVGVPNGRYAATKACRFCGPAGCRSQYEAVAYNAGPPNRPFYMSDCEMGRYPYPCGPRGPFLPPLAIPARESPNGPPVRCGRGYPPYPRYEEYRERCYCSQSAAPWEENPFAAPAPFAYDPLLGDYPCRTPCDF